MKLWKIGLLLIIAMVFIGCDNGNGDCNHSTGPVATCTTPQTCTKCGAELAPINPNNHQNIVDGVCILCGVMVHSQIESITALTTFFNFATGGATAADPIEVVLAIELGDMKAGSGWADLLDAIAVSGKFVSLDLSRCGSQEAFDARVNPADPTTAGKNKIVSIILPPGVRSIADGDLEGGSWNYIFRNFTALTYIEGYSLFAIGNYAFMNCVSLQTVNISLGNGGSIGRFAFSNCTSLTSISFSQEISIGNNAFDGCVNLQNVDLQWAQTIGNNAFFGCTSLQNINIRNANSIGNGVFSNTGSTTLTITMGAIAPTVGTGTFDGVTSPKQVFVKVHKQQHATDFGNFGTVPALYFGDIYQFHLPPGWGHGLRGYGWTGSDYVINTLNGNIAVYMEEYTLTP